MDSLNDIVFGGFQKVSIRQTSMSQLSRRGFYYIGIRYNKHTNFITVGDLQAKLTIKTERLFCGL